MILDSNSLFQLMGGALWAEKEPYALRPWRFSREHVARMADNDVYMVRAAASAGMTLDFETDSRNLSFELEAQPGAGTPWFGVDVMIDDQLYYHAHNKNIEYMNSRHSTQLQELNGELEFLREKLTAAEAAPAVNSEMIDRLNAALLRIGELEARCAALEQEKQEALEKADTSDLQARCEALEKERDEALLAARQAQEAQSAAARNYAEQELEAYRRAERTERLAKERAEKVYTRVNGVLSDATVKVDEASAQISEVSEQVLSRLSQLQSAVAGSKQALEEAVATMYAIRPTGEE